MYKIAGKIGNTKGFTLVETLIGLMILTMAIVAATSLLIGLIQSNRQIVKTLQAHYLAQEGLEAVRNIRDTNWMHNLDWKAGRMDFLGGFEISSGGGPVEYSVGLDGLGFGGGVLPEATDLNTLARTWNLRKINAGESSKIYLCGEKYFSNDCSSAGSGTVDTGFTRIIEISKPIYCLGSGIDGDFCKNAMLVRSIVKFDKGGEASLEEVLTNWKGGAL